MRLAVFGVLVVTALVVRADEEPWVEEEDLEEPYTNEREESIDRLQRDTLEPRDDHERRRREVYYEDYQPIETRERRRREVYVEEPYEHVRVKRCCYDEPQVRVRREASYQRVPRQVHQYEVYESTDEGSAPAPTYEEMLAASAEHYHRVYAAPGAPAPERYADPESIKGFNHHQHLDKGAKGHKTDEHHRQEYDESAGKKKKHHDHAGHKGGHEEEAHGHRGAHFDEKKGHKKGHKTKGYHNKYHKDEFHKEHKFYDDFHKSGEHHRYGKFHAKHASNESGKKKAHHVNAGHDFVERGKKGYSNKGHLDADHKGYNGKHGHEEHHEKHSSHGKKGGGEGGKEYGYAKKN